MASPLVRIARDLERLKREVRRIATQPRLAYSSLEDGAIHENDIDGVVVQVIGKQHDGTSTPAQFNGPTPPTPSAPLVSGGAGVIATYWDGTFLDGIITPMNFSRISVHAVQDPGDFDPTDTAQRVGTIESAAGGEITSQLPAGEWYIALYAWSQSGLYSEVSEVGFATSGVLVAPTEPPASSPDVQLTGFAGGLLAVAQSPLAATDLLEWHISTTVGFTPDGTTLLGPASRDTIRTIDRMPDGTLLLENTTYYVKTIATNVVDDGPVGNEANAQMDMSTVKQLLVAELVAGRVFTGEIVIGNGRWNATDGLVLPQPDGGFIRLPVDGTTLAQIDAAIRARSLVVDDNMVIKGTAQLLGEMIAAAGISNPKQKPTNGGKVWDYLQNTALGTPQEGFLTISRGMAEKGVNWWTAMSFFNKIYINSVNKTTGGMLSNLVTGTNLTIFAPHGLVHIGSYFYCLGQDLNRSGQWYIYKIDDTTFAKVGEFQITAIANSNSNNVGLGTDGTSMFVAWVTSGGVLRTRTLDTSIAVTASLDMAGSYSTGMDIGAVYNGSGDFGANRWVIMPRAGTALVFNSSGVAQATQNFARGGGGNVIGMLYDSTVGIFRSADDVGRFWEYTGNKVDTGMDSTITWYNSDTTGGSPTVESMASPKLVNTTWYARSKFVLDTQVAPEVGGDPSLNHDLANQKRVYVCATGGTPQLQATLAIGVDRYVTTSIATGTGASPGSNGFAALPGQQLGNWHSQADDGVNFKWQFFGDGTARIKALLSVVDLDGETWHSINPAGVFTAGTGNFTPQYRLDVAGNVHLRGRITKNGAADGATFFTLPTGYRPSGTHTYVVNCAPASAVCMVQIGTGGVMTLNYKIGTPTTFDIDCCFSIFS